MSLADAYCNVFDGAEKEAERIKEKLLQKEREVKKLSEATLRTKMSEMSPQFRTHVQHLYQEYVESRREAKKATDAADAAINKILEMFTKWRAKEAHRDYRHVHDDANRFADLIGIFDTLARTRFIRSLINRFEKLEEEE